MPSRFSDGFQVAGRAIEEVIVDALPDAAGVWPNIKPYEDTGLTVAGWLATVEAIVHRLNELIEPDEVRVPESVAKEHGGKFLYEFQLYLASVIP